jgi:proline iminopeptidase
MISQKIQHETGKIVTKDGEIWFKISGEGNGFPVICLHGGPGFAHDYLEPLELLGTERKVIFYDQLGSGRSTCPKDSSLWRIERFVDELEFVRDVLKIEKFHLFGSSWGTMLGMDYYLKYPESVASIVFKSPCLSAKLWASDAKKLCAQMGPEWNRITFMHETAGTTDSAEYKEAKEQFSKRFICTLEKSPIELERAKLGFNADVYMTMWGPSEFTATGNLKDYDRTADLPKIKVPTLFTCGRYDEATPETVKIYQKQVPGSQLAIFENSAHVAHLEEAELFRSVVSRFWKSYDDSAN